MATYKVIGKGQNGKYMDDCARENVISYCKQNKKTEHRCVGSMAVNIDHAAEEMTILSQSYNNDEGLRLRHSVIGFEKDRGITLEEANEIAQKAIEYYGNEYQILYCVHEDTDDIHAHIVMNQVSYLDGHKYRGTKKEYYDFINYMKDITRAYGIPFIAVSDN